MPITTTVTTSSSGTTTTVDVRVDDAGPGGGDRYIDVILSFDPTKLEFDSPLPADATDLDTTRTNVWWNLLLPGTGYVTKSVKVKPRGGIPFYGSTLGTLIVLDPVNSNMVTQTFYISGGPAVNASSARNGDVVLTPRKPAKRKLEPKKLLRPPKGPGPKKPVRGGR